MEKTETSPTLGICNAGPLIHLDELGCLDLLTSLPERSTLHIKQTLLKSVISQVNDAKM